MEGEFRFVREFREARAFQADIVIGAKIVYADDDIATREQCLADVKTDEAGGSCHENGHWQSCR
jgi:hypothetical protein